MSSYSITISPLLEDFEKLYKMGNYVIRSKENKNCLFKENEIENYIMSYEKGKCDILSHSHLYIKTSKVINKNYLQKRINRWLDSKVNFDNITKGITIKVSEVHDIEYVIGYIQKENIEIFHNLNNDYILKCKDSYDSRKIEDFDKKYSKRITRRNIVEIVNDFVKINRELQVKEYNIDILKKIFCKMSLNGYNLSFINYKDKLLIEYILSRLNGDFTKYYDKLMDKIDYIETIQELKDKMTENSYKTGDYL